MEFDTKNPTHDQIWDDSALVDSWNSALAEYQKYHSIHAKGGAVSDLLVPDDEDTKTSSTSDAKPETSDPITAHAAEAQTAAPHDANKKSHVAPPPMAGMPGMGPQVMLGSIQDEGLKRLLMSWYYAGYYTGLYEGKQQAEQGK